MHLGRPPLDAEIDDGVAKELKRISELKSKPRKDFGVELQDLRSRMTEVEGSMDRLESSQVRIEEMLKELLGGKQGKDTISVLDVGEPSSCAQAVERTEALAKERLTDATVQKDLTIPVEKADTLTLGVSFPVTGDVPHDAAAV